MPMDFELEVQRLKRAGQDVERTEEALGSVQEQTCEEPKAEELSQEQLHQMIMVIPVKEVYVEALHVKYPIIDWEIYSKDTRKYWKIIRVGGHTEAYLTFDDMLKKFNRDDLDKLWNFVKERFRTIKPTKDKARELWVELKRGHDIYMLVEKDYPLIKALATLMMCNKLRVDQVMEFENAQSNTTAKLPILKLENGNAWVSVPQIAQKNGTSVTKMSVHVTAEEKTNKKNDMKARSSLLMALPNEHQLTFSQYNDAKTMFAAIET
ncbi:hypothetical protein Tco_1124049 [Tanacetum coccineum]|uniref:Uncharacterized protein n=1 Tax=Tanacetum coccineum TaxID=301880 RepID=A0ABQ5J8X6_9ASTR